MRVLITGGSGMIGSALVESLFRSGHDCFVLSRRAEMHRAREKRKGVSWLSLPDDLPAVDAVVHLAGESVAAYWTRRKKRRILDSRVNGTAELMERLAKQGRPPGIVLSASAVGWYGNRPGEILDENAGADPEKKFRWQVCQAWEKAAEPARNWGARLVLLRIGNVLDPSGGYLEGLLKFWRLRCGVGFGGKENQLSWIGLNDAVRLIEFALETKEIEGPLNLTSPAPATQGELVEALAEAGKPFLKWIIPPALLRLGLGEFAQAVAGSQAILPQKALAHGYRFEHPTLKELMAFLRPAGKKKEAVLKRDPLIYERKVDRPPFL